MLEVNKTREKYLIIPFTPPAGDDTEQTTAWTKLTNFNNAVVVLKLTTAAATGIKALKFVMSDKDDGTGEQVDVLVKEIPTADPGLFDADEDQATLELSASNAAQALLDAGKNELGILYIAAKYTLDTGSVAVGALWFGEARFTGGLTVDIVAPTP